MAAGGIQDALSGHALFKARENMESTIAALGLDMRLQDVRETLTPAAIGERTAGNRYCIQPMEGCDGTLDGRPGELTFRRWARFGSGGAKLVWGEATAVVADGRANPRQLLLTDDTAGDMKALVETARSEHRKAWGAEDDLLVGIQLTHSGRFSVPEPRVASVEPDRDDHAQVKGRHASEWPAMSDEDLASLREAYVRASLLARDAGADFVDIKQCHGYLLSELLSARSRTGPYGGSLQGRTRFVLETLSAIRDAAGDQLLLATRMNVFDGVPYRSGSDGRGEPVTKSLPYAAGFGTDAGDPSRPDLREPIEAVGMLRDAGVSLLNVTAGCPYTNPHIGRPADKPPVDGYKAPEHPLIGVQRHLDMTATIQRAYPDLAVVGTGYSYLRPYLAMVGEAQVRSGSTTFVGVGRGAIAYPDFVRDLLETGEMSPRKVCVTVSHCTNLMRAKGNEMGQYAAGCVPRDPVYAKLLQEIRVGERAAK